MSGSKEGLNSLFNKPMNKDSKYREVDINLVIPNKDQPRTNFDPDSLHELSLSIKENGIIEPLVVVQKGNEYELIAGERRLRASKLAELQKVPVIIKEVTDKQKSLLAIIENLQREDLGAIELATSYKKAMDSYDLTQEQLAKKLGKARSSIANCLRLLSLPEEVKEIAQDNTRKVTSGHLKIIASIKDKEKAILLTKETVEKNLTVQKLKSLSSEKKEKPKDESISKSENLKELDSVCKIALKESKEGSVSIKFKSLEDLINKLEQIKQTINKERSEI